MWPMGLLFLSTSVSCHGMFFQCICIVYVCYVFLRVAVFFSHKQASLVYNRYMSWDGFPMFLHCIRSLHFLKDVSDLFFFDSVQLYKLSTFVTCH